MDFAKLKQLLQDKKEPSFRFKQISKSYYSGRFDSFENMTDISKDLRKFLSANLNYLSLKPIKTSVGEQTEKVLLETHDGQKIESVLMNYDEWITVCVSSQVGCPLACKFCATGKMGFKRNLTTDEIVDQIIFWNQKLFPKYVGRIVLMGMGEPFLNWDNVISAINIINSKEGLDIGVRKISISTAGVVDRIDDFANLNTQINLAVSLHSADQKKRESIMPIARQYSLEDLKKSCDLYAKKTKRQIFFEYALMSGVNDSLEDLSKIIKFIQSNHLFYLNIIPLNKVDGGMTPSNTNTFNQFIYGLEKARINFSIRKSFGQSLDAACGQLVAKN